MVKPKFDEDFGGPQPKKSSLVTVPVNGQKLQALRQQAGLTQEDLAEKAGYSDRLIRKAEASGPLRKSTIADLAAALSTVSHTVTADDLMFSREMISLDMATFLLHGSNGSAASFQDLIHPDFAIIVAGHELNIPFAGTHCGPEAYESFREQLQRSFEVIHFQPKQARCFVAARETCVQATTLLRSSSTTAEQPLAMEIWWFLKTCFEASRLVSVELNYDTGNICRLLGCL